MCFGSDLSFYRTNFNLMCQITIAFKSDYTGPVNVFMAEGEKWGVCGRLPFYSYNGSLNT